MADFAWPTTLDDARKLLDVVGSFWADTYAGNSVVSSVLHAKGQRQAQCQNDLEELLASFSRLTVPVLHRDTWTRITLAESAVNATNLPKWDGTYTFDSGIEYGVPVTSQVFSWAISPELKTVYVLCNGITNATAAFVRGIDFDVADGVITFAADPFLSPKITPDQVFVDGIQTDRTVTLWAYGAESDRQTMYTQFGYVVGLNAPSSDTYKKAVNAVYDGLVRGTGAGSLADFLSAVAGVPFATGDETVEHVLQDSRGKWVVTDKAAYAIPAEAAVSVAVGDSLTVDDAMCDAVVIHELNRGGIPAGLKAVTAGRGVLAAGFVNELTFLNEDVDVTVESADGEYTKMSFPLGGWDTDVEKFWDDVHAAGVAAGQTLAMLLDSREVKTGQPTAIALPKTVNPLKFLIDNFLRGSTILVTLRPGSFGPDAMGLTAATLLRKIVPPHTLCLLSIQHNVTETLALVGVGTETDPGYDEVVTTFLGTTATETVSSSDFVDERVRAYQITGFCL